MDNIISSNVRKVDLLTGTTGTKSFTDIKLKSNIRNYGQLDSNKTKNQLGFGLGINGENRGSFKFF